MYWFLILLFFGFICNSASAFTTFFSRPLGERGGKWACIVLRDVLGIPVWAAGYALAITTPSKILFSPLLGLNTLAWVLIFAGAVMIFTGLVAIRWRAAAPSMQDELVAHGIYAHIRHPLYSGMMLELAGLLLWIPTANVLIACTIGIIWAVVQARLEEIDLLLRMPAYKDYLQRVPRFIPRLR